MNPFLSNINNSKKNLKIMKLSMIHSEIKSNNWKIKKQNYKLQLTP